MQFDLNSVDSWLKIAIGVITLGALIWKYGKRPAKSIFFFFQNITKVLKTHDQLVNKIETIYYEVTPNGGGSIKDKINKIDKELKENTEVTRTIFYRQRWILDQRDEPIFESGENGECLWVNNIYIKVFKKNKEEYLGEGWKNLIHSNDKDRVFKEWDYCVKHGIGFECKYKMYDNDGKLYSVFCRADKTDSKGYIGTLKILDE